MFEDKRFSATCHAPNSFRKIPLSPFIENGCVDVVKVVRQFPYKKHTQDDGNIAEHFRHPQAN
jgi:hypothetical protein